MLAELVVPELVRINRDKCSLLAHSLQGLVLASEDQTAWARWIHDRVCASASLSSKLLIRSSLDAQLRALIAGLSLALSSPEPLQISVALRAGNSLCREARISSINSLIAY